MTAPAPKPPKKDKIRLHIGGEEVRPGWKILNVQPHPGVDFLGNAMDLSQFEDASVLEVYASHVYEHLDYTREVLIALKEAHRVLVPDGLIRIGVPDLEALCKIILDTRLPHDLKWQAQCMLMGGQRDAFDYHKVAFTFDFLKDLLAMAGFKESTVRRVPSFGLFKDTTDLRFGGFPISLNVMALK